VSVTVRNAAVAKGDATLATAQFVVAGPLAENDKVYILSKLVAEASAALELPAEGREASEIIYRLADERAGVAEVKPDPTPMQKKAREPVLGELFRGARPSWRLAGLAVGGLLAGMGLSVVIGGALRLAGVH
jgi:hypothetical protein